MGFLLAGMGVAMLFFSVVLFSYVFGDDWTGLYEAITGFGLGGSAIALFGRCGSPNRQEMQILIMNKIAGMLGVHYMEATAGVLDRIGGLLCLRSNEVGFLVGASQSCRQGLSYQLQCSCWVWWRNALLSVRHLDRSID